MWWASLVSFGDRDRPGWPVRAIWSGEVRAEEVALPRVLSSEPVSFRELTLEHWAPDITD